MINYKEMRLILFYDLPVDNAKSRKEYSTFHSYLISNGFTMMQYSIYVRACQNNSQADKFIKRISKKKPKEGDVRILVVTEKQYENIIFIKGKMSKQEELLSSSKDLLIID